MTLLQNLLAIFQGRPDAAEPSAASVPATAAIDRARTCTSVDELAACIDSRDGFVREAALGRAAELASPQLFPAIVERLNDWVPQVRERAQQVLSGMLPALDTGSAMRLLPAMQHLRQAGRTDHSAWIASVEQALVDKLGAQAIVDGLLDPDPGIARACWKLTEAARLAPPDAAITRVLPASRDIVLARYAVDAIFRLPEPARGPLFRRALASSFGMVRAIALRPVLAEESAENDALATRMAADLHNWVRLIASGYLARRGIDTAAILVHALCADRASGTTMRACLAGLAELGCTGRLDLVRDFTRHPLARVQLSAYLAWLRLEPSRRDDIAREVLASPHRRVRKLALQLVRDEGAFLDIATGLSLMAEHDDLDMMFALVKGEAWSWLALIARLEPRSRQEPALRARLTRELSAWFRDARRQYAKPSAEQTALFKDRDTVMRLAALASKDEGKVAQRLRFELGDG